MVMTMDIWRFSGIFRLLMKFLNRRHFFCFFTDFDSISGNEGNFNVELIRHPRYVDMEKCIASGMDDYLRKPYSGEQLHAALAKVLPPGVAAALRALDEDGLQDAMNGLLDPAQIRALLARRDAILDAAGAR